jgi:hypothetical protein
LDKQIERVVTDFRLLAIAYRRQYSDGDCFSVSNFYCVVDSAASTIQLQAAQCVYYKCCVVVQASIRRIIVVGLCERRNGIFVSFSSTAPQPVCCRQTRRLDSKLYRIKSPFNTPEKISGLKEVISSDEM